MTLEAYLLARESFFLDLQYYSCDPKALNLTINFKPNITIIYPIHSSISSLSISNSHSQPPPPTFIAFFSICISVLLHFSPFVSPRFLSYFTSAPHRRAANLPSHPLYTRTPSLRGPKLEKIYIYLNIINIYIYIYTFRCKDIYNGWNEWKRFANNWAIYQKERKSWNLNWHAKIEGKIEIEKGRRNKMKWKTEVNMN